MSRQDGSSGLDDRYLEQHPGLHGAQGKVGGEWPRCKRCHKFFADHSDERHAFRWPPLTDRERAVADRIVQALTEPQP